MAARALAVDPDDTVRGKLRLCEGHLARINGTSHRKRADLSKAAEKFNEAQRLLPQSPDPELGLARVYVYGLKDIDKATRRCKAQKARLPVGQSREMPARRWLSRPRRPPLWDSRNVRGLPQEKDQIERADDDYQQALKLYQEIAPWGKAIANIPVVQQRWRA